jgi:hypothetical protein
MVVIPTLTAVTNPLPEPIVATPVLLLLHIEPLELLDNVVVEPTQIDDEPVMADGKALTVNACVR